MCALRGCRARNATTTPTMPRWRRCERIRGAGGLTRSPVTPDELNEGEEPILTLTTDLRTSAMRSAPRRRTPRTLSATRDPSRSRGWWVMASSSCVRAPSSQCAAFRSGRMCGVEATFSWSAPRRTLPARKAQPRPIVPVAGGAIPLLARRQCPQCRLVEPGCSST